VCTSACLSSSRRTVCLHQGYASLSPFVLRCASAQAFTSAAFEKDVVGNNDRGATVLLEDREDVLKEVELFIAGTRSDCPRDSAVQQ
jgi:hypothetical protein